MDQQNDIHLSSIEDDLHNSVDVIIPPKNERLGKDLEIIEQERPQKTSTGEVTAEKVSKEILYASRPFFFSTFIVHAPGTVLLISIFLMLALSVFTILAGSMQPSQSFRRDYLVWDSTPVKQYDMQYLAQEKVQTNYANGTQPLRTTLNEVESTHLVYELEGGKSQENYDECGSLLTVENLQKMYEIEKKFYEREDYKLFGKSISSSDSSGDPTGWSSFVKNNFEASISTLTQAQIDAKLAQISSNIGVYYQNNYFFNESFTQSNKTAIRMRAIFLFSNPIEHNGRRYKSFTEDEKDQQAAFVKFSKESRKELIDIPAKFSIRFYNMAWHEQVVNDITLKDTKWLVASFINVFFYMSFHLESTFLAGVAMVGIALSWPVTVFVNRFIFQITMFQFINFISLFVILGIAADDVFVFTDCWKQSATFKELKKQGDTKTDWLRKRMNYTWRRTAKAILTTSLTTCLSFAVTGASKLRPVSAFGFFSAVLVMMLYVFTITIYPGCIILYDKHLVNKCKYCSYLRYLLLGRCCYEKDDKAIKVVDISSVEETNKFESPTKRTTMIQDSSSNQGRSFSIENNGILTTRAQIKGLSSEESEDHKGENKAQNSDQDANQYDNRFLNGLDKPQFGLIELNVAQKREEEVGKKEKLEVKELTMIEKFFHNYWSSWINKFKYIIFGITIIWIGFAIWRITKFGTAKNHIQRLASSHPVEEVGTMIKHDFNSALNTGKIEVSFIWGLKGIDKSSVGYWDSDTLGKLIYDETFNLAPVANQQRVLEICSNLRDHELVENKVVTGWLEDFVASQGGGSPVPEASFDTLLKTYLTTAQGEQYYNQNLIGYYEGRLHFIQVVALTPEAPFEGRKKLYPIFKKWEALKDSYNNASPEGINKAFQTSGYHWAWLETESEMIRGFYVGLGISICFAFCVMLVSTLNIMIAIYAVICISIIVISEIAIMELSSWGLGVIEAIAIVMTVGLSVDYVVHLGNHYVECPFEDRYQRITAALTSIGISIVSGAITTMASGFFLLFTVIIYFEKIAILVFSTISISVFGSLLLFTGMNHLIGPEKHFGDLKYYLVSPFWKWIKTKCQRKRSREDTKN